MFIRVGIIPLQPGQSQQIPLWLFSNSRGSVGARGSIAAAFALHCSSRSGAIA
jgi:hypothetical protein